MRFFHCFLWLCLPLTLFSQESNSLLWEISGNGLQQPSYLYGTMHVSKRIAFLLDDVFYEALDKSAVIALESDPATWLESDTNNGNIGNGPGSNFNPRGFYTQAFALQSPDKKDLAEFIASDDRLVNNILYRTTEYSQDFEEDTYLDMFIYQAGSKFGKKILALEDLEESQALVGKASLNAMKRRPDEWLQEKMEQHDLMSLMQDAYRERNINLLDSIDRAMYTDHYLNHMLYIRNENMAKRLDSAIRRQVVFAGIGAAHLPGDKGVLALLQKEGYTVRPLVSEATEQGARLKEKFVTQFRPQSGTLQEPEDGFFSIRLPHKLYPVAEGQHITYISPDLTNGSYLMVHRIPTYSLLNRKTRYSLSDIEGLLFENIPGKILSQKRVSNQGFEGLDIRNQLKNGDHQRYQIYLTPLEILIFKMVGEGPYVEQYSDAVFNSLRLKPMKEGKQLLQSAFNDFELAVPSYYSFPNQSHTGKRKVEGYDPADGTYYFMEQVTLNDLDFIEQDGFELRQIQKRFYQRYGLEETYEAPVRHSSRSVAAFGKDKETKLHLQAELRRNDYFLLGVLTENDEAAKAYFDSFKIREPEYPEAFRQITDTALFFSTYSPVLPKKFVESSIGRYKMQGPPKPYLPYTKKTVYQYANNEAITVTMNKSHDYMTFPGIDSIWALRKKQYAGTSFVLQNTRTSSAGDGSHALQLILADTASSRGILVKNVVKGGLLYELKAPLDTLNRPSAFVEAFFDNFKPTDTLIGRDLMEDKTSDFFAALRANDSIVMKGYRYLLFDNRHADSLMYYLANFDFSGDKEHIQNHLLKELGQIKTPEVQEFLNQYYRRAYNNSGAQTRILQAASAAGDEASAQKLLQLLSQDLPLVSNPSEIYKVFAPFNDSLPLARALYPELLEYSSIPEYKEPIIGLLSSLVNSGLIHPKRYKSYLGILAKDANMQLKRQLGMENQSRMQTNGYFKTGKLQRRLLEAYAQLLLPFIKEKEVQGFFSRLFQVKDPEVRTSYAALLAREELFIPIGFIDSLAANINSRNLLFSKLQSIDKVTLFPESQSVQQALAAAALYEDQLYDPNIDTYQYIEERAIDFKGTPCTGYYFKAKSELDYNKNYKMYLLVYRTGNDLAAKPFYRNEGVRMADTDTDVEMMDYVTEEFLLKDHPRAMVPDPRGLAAYGF